MQRCTKALLLPAQFTAAGLDELIFVFLGAAQGVGPFESKSAQRLVGSQVHRTCIYILFCLSLSFCL